MTTKNEKWVHPPLPKVPEGDPWIVLRVDRKVPSLNVLLAQNRWQRKKERDATQRAVLSALKAAAEDSSTQGQTFTAEPKLLRTLAFTLESYLTTKRLSPKAQSSRQKSKARSQKKP